MSKRRSFGTTLGLAFLVALFMVVAFVVGNNVKNSTVSAAASYSTTTVRRSDLEELVLTSGRLVPVIEVDLSLQVSGVISTVLVKPGSTVQQGQPLVKLDTRELELDTSASQAALKQAQASLDGVKNGLGKDLANAQATLKQAQTRLLVIKTGGTVPAEDLQVAQAAIDQAQSRYNSLLSKPNPKDVQAAEAQYRQALSKLDQARGGDPNFASQLQQAQAALEGARQNLSGVTSRTNNAVEQARISLEQAQRGYDNAKASFDKIFGQNHNADGSTKPEVKQADLDAEKAAKNTLADAQGTLDKAKLNYSDAQAQADSGQKEAQSKVVQAQAALDKLNSGLQSQQQNQQQQVVQAQAELDQARANLDKANQGATKDELDAALADITTARAKMDKLAKSGVNEKEVALAQSEVEKAQTVVDSLNRGPSAAELNAAQASVDQADAGNKRAQLKLTQAVLVAPFTGVVGAIKVVPGQNVNTTTAAVSMLDLSSLKVNVVIPEADITKVQAGMIARLTLESLPNVKNLRGRIGEIAPKSTNLSEGLVGYQVSVFIDKAANPDIDPFSLGLKPGMSSNVRLVLDRKTDVLVVPRQAVRPLGDSRAVEVLTGSGQLMTVPVTTGMVGEKDVEVMEPSLLSLRDQVVLNTNVVPELNRAGMVPTAVPPAPAARP